VEKNKIKKVNLKDKEIDDVDLKKIIESLMENESVEVVDLSFNPSITGMNCFLDELLSYNDTIQEYTSTSTNIIRFNMEGCNIEKKEIEKILKALETFVEKDGTDLTKLHLGNHMSKEDEENIGKILNKR
jgi:hypothetical protein